MFTFAPDGSSQTISCQTCFRVTMACDLSRHKPIKIRKLEEIKRENRMAPLREGPAVIT
jgi:hypothetical protein